MNHLVDRNPHELRILSGYRYSSMYKSSETFPYNVDEEIKTAPENFDWRIEGGVTAVRGKLIKYISFFISWITKLMKNCAILIY